MWVAFYEIKRDIVIGDYTIPKGAHMIEPKEGVDKIVIVLEMYSDKDNIQADYLEPSRFAEQGVKTVADFFKVVKKLNRVITKQLGRPKKINSRL